MIIPEWRRHTRFGCWVSAHTSNKPQNSAHERQIHSTVCSFANLIRRALNNPVPVGPCAMLDAYQVRLSVRDARHHRRHCIQSSAFWPNTNETPALSPHCHVSAQSHLQHLCVRILHLSLSHESAQFLSLQWICAISSCVAVHTFVASMTFSHASSFFSRAASYSLCS